MRIPYRFLLLFLCSALVTAPMNIGAADVERVPYSAAVLADKPVAYWRLNDVKAERVVNAVPNADAFFGEAIGKVQLKQAGPKTELFPDFESGAQSAMFSGA